MTAKTRQRKRTINYIELMRKTSPYHSYSFQPSVWNKNLTKKQHKKDLSKARNSTSIRNLWETGQVTADQIQEIIKRKAIDYNINRNFTPAQKSAIHNQWYGTKTREDGTKYKTGLKSIITHVDQGEAKFIPIVNLSGKPQYNRMKHTNIGIFMFVKDAEVTTEGRGKTEYIKVDRGEPPKEKIKGEPFQQIFKRREEFYPFPKGVIIPDYIQELKDEHKPNGMSIGVMSSFSGAIYRNVFDLMHADTDRECRAIAGEIPRGIAGIIENAKRLDKTHPFSGVYFYFF